MKSTADEVMTEKPPPSNRTIGLLFTGVSALASVSLWRHSSIWLPLPVTLAGLFLLTSFAAPGVLTPLNRAWMGLAALLHAISSPIILGVLFFLLFTPVALFMKLKRRDAMTRRFDRSLTSYWNLRTPLGPAPMSLREQF
jgi:hypothetical protein